MSKPLSPRGQLSGQSLVEFALGLTVFLLLVLGIVDLGRVILFYNMLSNAARDGARVGIISTNTVAQMCAQAIAEVQAPGLTGQSCAGSGDPATTNDGTLTVSVHRGTKGSTASGGPDSVTLSYAFVPITPLIGTKTITITAESSMYVEN